MAAPHNWIDLIPFIKLAKQDYCFRYPTTKWCIDQEGTQLTHHQQVTLLATAIYSLALCFVAFCLFAQVVVKVAWLVSVARDFLSKHGKVLRYLTLGATAALLLLCGPLRVLHIKNEEQCADIGFCVPPQPSAKAIASVIGLLPYVVNACWIKNIFVWIGVLYGVLLAKVVHIFLPGLQQMPLLKMMYERDCFHEPKNPMCLPEITAQQTLSCMVNYSYAVVLLVLFIVTAAFAWPLVLYIYVKTCAIFAFVASKMRRAPSPPSTPSPSPAQLTARMLPLPSLVAPSSSSCSLSATTTPLPSTDTVQKKQDASADEVLEQRREAAVMMAIKLLDDDADLMFALRNIFDADTLECLRHAEEQVVRLYYVSRESGAAPASSSSPPAAPSTSTGWF